MGHVIFEALDERSFAKLPATVPPLEYIDGQVVQARDSEVVFEGLTLEQFLRLPEAKPALEYLDGKVVQKVSPKATHSVLQDELLFAIKSHIRPRKLGRTFPELRCTFGGRSIVPDISFFARGRLPRNAKGRLIDDVFLPPDLAIEVISPGQTIKNLTARLERAVRDGVRLAWLVQPSADRVYVFRPDRPSEVLEGDGVLSGEDVLPDFTLPLAELFGWLSED